MKKSSALPTRTSGAARIDLARSIDRRRLREDQALRENFEQFSWFSLPEDDTSRALQVAMAKIPGKISRGDHSEDLG